MDKDEIDWEEFIRDESWIFVIKPAILQMRQNAFEDMAKKATPETLSLLQGKILAYTEMLEEPEKHARTAQYNRAEAERKQAKEIADNEDQRPNWIRRAGARLRRSTA